MRPLSVSSNSRPLPYIIMSVRCSSAEAHSFYHKPSPSPSTTDLAGWSGLHTNTLRMCSDQEHNLHVLMGAPRRDIRIALSMMAANRAKANDLLGA
jgi:hypothetical protein